MFADYFCKMIQSYGFYSVDEETFIHEKALCVLIIKRATNQILMIENDILRASYYETLGLVNNYKNKKR